MKKVIRKVQKEERKVDLNEPLVIIEQDSSLTKKRVISYPFNKEKRDFTFTEDTKKSNKLGPGAYDLSNKRTISQNVVSKNSRFPNYENTNPGVGEYNVAESELKVENSAPKYQIPKAERKNPFEVTKEKRGVPGIGKYKLGSNYPKNFYIEEKVERFHTIETGKPGVGEYDINDAELKLKKKTGISTNKAKRKDPFEATKESKNVPGIGTYNITNRERKGIYIEGKKKRFETSYNGRPGVGEYDINDAELKLKKRIGVSTNKSKRKDPFEVDKEQKGKPGIGSYNINKENIKGVYIEGNAPRFTSSNDGKPGVGEYDINDAELKLKKKTGISTNKSKRKDPFEATKESKNVPGTGAYNINKGEQPKFYIEQNIDRFGPSGNKNPGVGEYDINEAELKLKKKTGISTNKATRKDPFEATKESKNVPGTGAYNINKGEQTKFYIEPKIARLPPSGNNIPGVGEYDHSPIEIKLKPKAPEYEQPKAERKSLLEQENNEKVGPGSYEIKGEDTKAGMQKFSTLPRNLS